MKWTKELFIGMGLIVGIGGIALTGTDRVDASTLYRAYNPNTGEHLYTKNANEIPSIVKAGWRNEGTAWDAPTKGTPVYRMFNPNNGGDHHFTSNSNEVNMLKSKGWRYEGESWKSGGNIPVYRLYNPNARSGAHHFTTLSSERDNLKHHGWRYEGVAFYSGKDSNPIQSKPVQYKKYDYSNYVTFTKTDQPIYSSLNKNIKSSSNSYIGRTFEIKLKYLGDDNHVIYSIYDNKNNWIGYVSKDSIEETSNPQGAWQHENKYIPINRKNLNFYSDFLGNIKRDSSNYFLKTLHVTGKYRTFDNELYYSVYSNDNSWVGYVREQDFDANNIVYSGHRGYAVGDTPENSVASVQNAVNNGFRSIEIDPRFTKDNVCVLMHDSTINRTTNGTGEINQQTYSELSQYNLKANGKLTDQEIPTLDTILQIANANDLIVNIDGSKLDWKNKEQTDIIMNLVLQNNLIDNVFFMISDQQQRDVFYNNYKQFNPRISWLYNSSQNIDSTVNELNKYNSKIFSIAANKLTPEIAQKINSKGISIHVYNIEGVNNINQLKKYNISLVETNTTKP